MLLAATEMSCIQGEDAPLGEGGEYEGVEVIGGLWGTIGRDAIGRRLYTVRRATVSLQSHGDAGSVGFDGEAKELHKRLMASFSPQLGWLGSFHSHPYIHETDVTVVENKLDRLSPQDVRIQEKNPNEELMLVVTIARFSNTRKDILPAMYRETGNARKTVDYACVEFELNDLAIWIRASVRVRTEIGFKAKGSPQVVLHSPRLLGMFMRPGNGFAPLIMESVSGHAV